MLVVFVHVRNVRVRVQIPGNCDHYSIAKVSHSNDSFVCST